MDIEEHELQLSSEAALRSWRLFRVRSDRAGLVLASPMYHDDRTGLTPLWPHRDAVATCHMAHAAPFPGCRCGIYGAVAGTLDSLPGYVCDTAYERDPWVYAEIACHGRLFIDMRGVRAERATLVRIALPASSFPDDAARQEALRLLEERYGVPVAGADAVPGWVTTNSRHEGAPPDDARLGLDLGRLDLSRRIEVDAAQQSTRSNR